MSFVFLCIFIPPSVVPVFIYFLIILGKNKHTSKQTFHVQVSFFGQVYISRVAFNDQSNHIKNKECRILSSAHFDCLLFSALPGCISSGSTDFPRRAPPISPSLNSCSVHLCIWTRILSSAAARLSQQPEPWAL